MRVILALALATSFFLLTACATATFDTPAKLGQRESITGTQIYVYSFLDLRRRDLGGGMVEAVNRQLGERLAERGVETRFLTYSEATGKPVTGWPGSVSVPVARIVADHLNEEIGFGAEYRLLAMPSSMNLSGAGQRYQVLWSLVDVASGDEVWRTTLNGGRTVWLLQDEDAEARAAMFVDGVIAEMTRSGLLAPASSPVPQSAPN